MTREEFKAKVSMALCSMKRETWEDFLEAVWRLHLEVSNHWTPVEKELPPKIEGEEITKYYWVAGLNGEWYDVLRYDYRYSRWSDHYGHGHACVTHWMEIVPPRKEDKK